MRLGRAIGYFRLVAPDLQKFGHRLWIDVHVRNPIFPPAVPRIVLPPVEDIETGLNDMLGFAMGEIVENIPSSATTNDELMRKYSQQVETLCDMGFLDIGKNLEMLDAHNGDVDAVLALLLN